MTSKRKTYKAVVMRSRGLLPHLDNTMPARWAATETWVRAQMAAIEADERYHYKPALVEVNAPLALEQVGMSARMQVLKKVLELLGGKP